MHTHFAPHHRTIVVSSAGAQIEVTLHTVFASKKKQADGNAGEKAHFQSSSISPGNFQVSAKLDEETRKDGILTLSFVISLNDSRGLVTYEFRGLCTVTGTSPEFAALMGTEKNRVPPILDAIYQRLYPVMFLMSGVTIAPYPQATTLVAEMIAGAPASQPEIQQPSPASSAPNKELDAKKQQVGEGGQKPEAIAAKKSAEQKGPADLVTA